MSITSIPLTDEQLKEIQQLRSLLENKKLIKANINKTLSDKLKQIEARENKVISITTDTNLKVKDLHKLVDKIHRHQKKSIYIIAASLFIIIILLSTWAVYNFSNQPFNFTLQIYGWKGKQHNPLSSHGTINLYFGDKIERAEINSQREANFINIPAEYKNKKVSVVLNDLKGEPYFLKDSVTEIVKNGKVFLQVNFRGLDVLEGIVIDAVTGSGLYKATVIVAEISTFTDSNGKFRINIPQQLQETEQRVEIFKDDYNSRVNTIPMMGNHKHRIVLDPTN